MLRYTMSENYGNRRERLLSHRLLFNPSTHDIFLITPYANEQANYQTADYPNNPARYPSHLDHNRTQSLNQLLMRSNIDVDDDFDFY